MIRINMFDRAQMAVLGKKALVYALCIYVLIILGRAIWMNWVLKNEMDQIKNQIVRLEQQNKNLENLIIYYQSDSFKELEARQKLGLKKPDEKVVSVPVRKYNDSTVTNAESIILGKNEKVKIANWRAWWIYFFE